MAKKTISVVKGKGSLAHNNRDFVTENVDKNRIKFNVTFKQETLEQAYEKCFGQAIAEYNSKQKRSDRRIAGSKGYLEQIRTSKNGEKIFYENVVQVGNMFDSHVETKDGDICSEILEKYMRDFEERNPNLYVFNAVLHNDEKTPHLHIDYIPIAKGYKQGLMVRNSLDRALKQQGVKGTSSKYSNSTIEWQNREKNEIETLMKEYGLERAEDKGLHRKHKTNEEYKAIMENLENKIQQLPNHIENTKPAFLSKTEVVVKKEELEQLEERAKLTFVHSEEAKQLTKELKNNYDSTKQYTLRKMVDANQSLTEAENYERKKKAEFEKALNYRKQAEKLLNELKKNDIETLRKENKLLSEENALLKAENTSLKAQFEEKVQNITQSLEKRILSLTERLERISKGVSEMAMAIKALDCANKLNAKQKTFSNAIIKYAKELVFNNSEKSQCEKLSNDIDTKYVLSKNIRKYMHFNEKQEELQEQDQVNREFERE